jgi:hypothetical protein
MQWPIAPVSSIHGCDGSRQTPIRLKRPAYIGCLSPWWLCHPRRTLVPRRVHWVRTILVVARRLAPIHGWLALRAIRFAAHRGRRHGIPFNLSGFWPVNDEGLLVAVVTLMRSSESHQMVFAPSACGNTRGQACEPRPCGQALNSSSLSCARRTVWPRC